MPRRTAALFLAPAALVAPSLPRSTSWGSFATQTQHARIRWSGMWLRPTVPAGTAGIRHGSTSRHASSGAHAPAGRGWPALRGGTAVQGPCLIASRRSAVRPVPGPAGAPCRIAGAAGRARPTQPPGAGDQRCRARARDGGVDRPVAGHGRPAAVDADWGRGQPRASCSGRRCRSTIVPRRAGRATGC